MECSDIKYYPFSINARQILKESKSLYSYSETIENGMERLIECDTEKKWMTVKEKKKNDSDWTEIDLSEIKEDDILDLDETGIRWEGFTLHREPFGYGKLYNENNEILYIGFIYNKSKECYGVKYYSDCSSIEYVGSFHDNIKHGHGKLYDKKGALVYDGDWVNNNPVEISCVKIENELTNQLIHFDCKELTICSKCKCELKEFHLIHFNQLEKLVIEEEALDSIKVFEINSCDNLSSILIGDSNFKSEALKKGELHITNCKKLTEIEIQSNSFLKYSIFELTSLLFFSIFTQIYLY